MYSICDSNNLHLTLSRLRGEGGAVLLPHPPCCFFLNKLKTADIRTLKLLHFFNFTVLNKFSFNAQGRMEGSQMAGRCFKKKEMVNNFLLIKLQGQNI